MKNLKLGEHILGEELKEVDEERIFTMLVSEGVSKKLWDNKEDEVWDDL